MNCKNCKTYIQLEYRFCPNCGAKTEVRRITFKALLRDFLDRLFDLDNSIFRTIKHLITKPNEVIHGYLSGIRKRYLNPVSLLGIALTLGGILLFLIQKGYAGEIDFTGGAQNVNPEFSRKWADITFDFNAFFFLLYLPVFALPAYLLLNKAKYNLAEYFVVFIYIMSEYSLLTFPVSLSITLIEPAYYMTYSQISMCVLLGYTVYVLWKLNTFRPGPFIGRILVFLLLLMILFFLLILGLMALLFLTGYFTLDDFRPIEASAETVWLLAGQAGVGFA
jgi:hypothetical protein